MTPEYSLADVEQLAATGAVFSRITFNFVPRIVPCHVEWYVPRGGHGQFTCQWLAGERALQLQRGR